jgi:transposase
MNITDFVKTLIGYPDINVLDFRMEADKYHPEQSVFVAKVVILEDGLNLCPICGQKCKKYDCTNDIKRWRSLDLGKNKFFIESKNTRCLCSKHGVLKCLVPWAFPDSDYTKALELRVAYMAAKTPTNLVSKEYRIKWGTVGNCVRRVQKYVASAENRLNQLKRIGIDETSYRKGITVVQNLDTGGIVWASDGHGDEVLKLFFESLSEKQRSEIEFVSADGAQWITRQVEAYCPNAKRCVDPFHVVEWATETLDNVRKRLASDTKKNDSHS